MKIENSALTGITGGYDNLPRTVCSPNWMLGYGNAPHFEFEIPDRHDSLSVTDATYKHLSETSLLAVWEYQDGHINYQSVCTTREAGNTNYAIGHYPSGWSSRVSVINKAFDMCMVEAGQGSGIPLYDALRFIDAQYKGWVLMWVSANAIEVAYHLLPWDWSRDAEKHVPENGIFMYLDTHDHQFVERAECFLHNTNTWNHEEV